MSNLWVFSNVAFVFFSGTVDDYANNDVPRVV